MLSASNILLTKQSPQARVNFFHFSNYTCVCVYACHGTHMEVREKILRFFFIIHHEGCGDQTQMLRLDDKTLYKVSHLVDLG